MSLKKTHDVLGKKVNLYELVPGMDILVCPAKPSEREKYYNTCDAGTVVGAELSDSNRHVILYLTYDLYGKPAFHEFWFPVTQIRENESVEVDERQYDIFLRKYGKDIAAIVEKEKLPAGVEIELAEMLTGKRPKSFLPGKGGRSKTAKGRTYHKRAGLPLTRRVQSSSGSSSLRENGRKHR